MCQLYVDDINFGSPNKAFGEEFAALMTSKFKMSSMGEVKFFLGFEVKQRREGTFINQAKYTQDMLKRFKLSDVKPASTPIPSMCFLCFFVAFALIFSHLWCFACVSQVVALAGPTPVVTLAPNVCATQEKYQKARLPPSAVSSTQLASTRSPLRAWMR